LNPWMEIAYTNRAHARTDQGDLPGAIADYQRYLTLEAGRGHTNHSEIMGLIFKLQLRINQ
ncbi:MAG: tetratricopeptide repeat protein, partial [Armatimonadetes bacterium]|nr:tetratricopeptide repeat protein [Anaerolineae bacterium]